MSARSTRSKQRAEEAAKASPAHSTRSGGRSASPAAFNIGLRSSSPSSLGSTVSVETFKSVRGRGRGRGTTTSPTPRATRQNDKPLAKRGRIRGRGRGRGCKTPSSVSQQNVSDNEEVTPCQDSILKTDPDDFKDANVHIDSDALKEHETIDINDTTKPDVSSITKLSTDEKMTGSTSPESRAIVSDNATEGSKEVCRQESVLDSNFTGDAGDAWVDTNLNLNENLDLTVENLKQLESVLTSEEALKLLTEQPESVEAINNITLDESVIPENSSDKQLVPETLEKAVETEVPPADSDQSAPRRKSERVTDLERRALAEKIRQENIRQEKEMLEKLKMDSKPDVEVADKSKPSEVETVDVQPNRSKVKVSEKSSEPKRAPSATNSRKPVARLAPKRLTKPTSKLLKTTHKSKVDVDIRQSADKIPAAKKSAMKKQSVSEDAVESEAIVKTPDGSGWIPGKIKVIDRKSGSSEKAERLRRKSQELKRRLSSAAEDLFKPDEPADKKTRREKAKQTLRDDEVSGGETGSSSEEEDADDAEWKEEDDPDRLWCVCRKPHDNRFMICCDRCEEWYHGDCVGISRKRGTQMETENEEYICSQCKEKELVEQLGGVEKLSEPSSLLVTSSVTTSLTPSTPETTADGKPMIKLQGEIRKKKANTSGAEKRKKFAVFPVQTPRQHCIGSGCDNWAEENKIYCSLNCIIKHANESLDIINKEKSKTVGPKHESGKVSADLVVMERHTGRLVTGAHAPVPDNLISWLTKHPSYEVLRPGQQMGHVSSSSSFYGKKKSKLLSSSEDKSQKRTSSAKEEDAGTAPKKSTGPDPAAIRSNVKKSMVDALKERLKETSDSKTKEDEIKSIAASIEHELYKLYGETNSKYKSRFRSLVFNIKDPKNKGLFRKILRKKLKPSKLVRMTPDELASKELHQWREKEMQSELEKIKADEERKAAIKPLLRKITHKGEIEVEQDTYKDLDTKLEESLKDYDMTKFSGDHHTSEKTSDQSISEHSVDLLSSIMESGDTTPQHDAHLFDSNCKICIGKQAAPSKADLEKASNRVKVSHEVSRSAIRSSKESSKEELDKSIKNELEDLEKEIKIFEAEDKIIAEKLAKRRHSHQDTKKRVRVQENNSPGDEPAARTHSPGTPPLPDLSSPTPVVKKRGSTPSAWKGFIDAPEISCKFFTTAHGVHGNSDCLKTDLPDSLQIVGRIHPNQVWEYIGQLRHTLSREVILIRFSAVNEEEKASYKVYFKYLSEKKRFGVVGNGSSDIKDMYIIPLPSHESLPVALKPYRHKVLADDNRPNMLVGLVVRTKLKRTGSQDPLYGSKKSKSDEDEPYEPPGIDELLPAEPETPSPMTTPNNAEPFDIKNVEEYDPSQPLVSLSVGNSQEGQEENEMYDPIVSAYSLADPKTLNAEDVPGAAPYSPGENDAEDGDEAYDPGSLPIAITPSQSEPLPHKSPSTNPYRIAAPLPAEPSEPYDPMDTLNAKSPPMPREPYNPMRTSPPAPDKPYNPAAALSRAFPSHPEELYDPAAPLSPQKSGRDQSSSSHASISLLMDSDLTAQQRALKELTAQVELQKKQLHKARLAQQILPMQSETVSHQLVSGQSSQLLTSSTTDISQTEITKQFLTQSIESKNTPVAPPVLATPKESNLDPNIPIAESERPKISFSFSGIRNVSHSSQFQNNESTNHSGPPPPQNKVPLLAPPPPPVSLSSNNLLSPASHRPLLSDPRVASGPDQTHSRDRYPGGANDPDQTHCSDRYSGGANGPDQTHSRDGFPGGASGPDQTHSRNRYSGGADGPDQTHSKDGFPRGASGPGQTHSRDGLPRGASGPGRILIRDEDMGQRDFRENYGDRRGWQDSYDGRAHWRAPPPSRDAGYRQGMPGEYDYHNRNRRGGYGQGPDERYHRDY